MPVPQPKVLKKHDLVNIVVQEVSQYASTGTTDLKRNSDLDAKVDQFVSLNLKSLSLHGTGTPTNPVEVKMEGARDFKGDASVDRSDTFTLRLEAEVIDVKPNGTMVLQAKKHIKTDDEEQTFIPDRHLPGAGCRHQQQRAEHRSDRPGSAKAEQGRGAGYDQARPDRKNIRFCKPVLTT